MKRTAQGRGKHPRRDPITHYMFSVDQNTPERQKALREYRRITALWCREVYGARLGGRVFRALVTLDSHTLDALYLERFPEPLEPRVAAG